MRKLKKILVIIEPQQMRQTALERALALVQAGHGSHKIIAVLPIDNLTKASDPQDAPLKGEALEVAVKTRARRWLHAYLAIHAMGLEIDERVLISTPKNMGRDLVKMSHDEGVDLIIKHHDERRLRDMLSVPLDLQLLRHAPVPVLISRDHIWHPTGIIALALDFYDPESVELRQLNMRLLREAQELSRIMHCEIHIVNAIAPIMPPSTLDLPGFTPDMLGDEVLKEGCRSVLAFAARHKIPASHCHIREGLADEVIPAICSEIKPMALFIGTSARKGLSGALVGNICERVTHALECDVAVITPKAVIERTPRVLNV